MNLTRAASIVLLALLVGAPCPRADAGDPLRGRIASSAPVGMRVASKIDQELVVRRHLAAKPDETRVTRTVHQLVTVLAAGGGPGAEQFLVDTPRAVYGITAPQGTRGGIDPFHGTHLRLDPAGGAWSAQPVGGPTVPELLRVLEIARPDPLRRPLVPQGDVTSETDSILAGTSQGLSLRTLLPVPVENVASVSLRMSAAAGQAQIARLSGEARARIVAPVSGAGNRATDITFDVREEVSLADGLLREIAVAGVATFVVKIDGRDVSVDVEVRGTETSKRLAAGEEWANPNGPGAPRGSRTLAPALDARKWVVVHHRSAGEAITERVPEGQRVVAGSEEGWTEMVTVHRRAATSPPDTVDRFFAAFKASLLPTVKPESWRVVSRSEDDLVYEFTVRGDAKFHDQHELGRIVRDDAWFGVLQVRYTRKVPALPPADRAAWLERLARARIVGEEE